MIGDDMGGPVFICGRFPRERKTKCSVCKTKWSTLLCDGEVAPGKTCDAKLCEGCTTRPLPGVIALPDHRGGWMNGVRILHHERRLALRAQRPTVRMRDDVARDPNRPTHVDVPPETVDFCPDCARRPQKPRQGVLL